MSRSRNIKPGFFKNDRLAECNPLARILFAGLWCEADREGRLEDRPKRLKAEYLAYDECDVDELLSQLAARGFIVRYVIDGAAYIAVPEFLKHQNPHCKEQASRIPAPEKPGASTVQAPCMNGSSTEVARLIPDSLLLIPDSKEKKPAPQAKRSPISIEAWLESLGEELPIRADDPIFKYCAEAKIPRQWLELAWLRFVEDMTDKGKRKLDWRAHFRNAVKGNWLHLWWISDGKSGLTTVGEQAKAVHA